MSNVPDNQAGPTRSRPNAKKPWYRRPSTWVVATAAVIGAWVGFASDILALWDRFTGGSAEFTADLATEQGVEEFKDFAKENDHEIVRIDSNCLYPDDGEWSGCRWRTDLDDPADEVTSLEITSDRTCPFDVAESDQFLCPNQPVLLRFRTGPNIDAQVDNGKYGAGNIVIHGYFSVSYDVGSGVLPPEFLIVTLNAVAPEDAPR